VPSKAAFQAGLRRPSLHDRADRRRVTMTRADSLAQVALAQEQNDLLAIQTSLTQERKLWEIAIAEGQEQRRRARVKPVKSPTRDWRTCNVLWSNRLPNLRNSRSSAMDGSNGRIS
jgi:hypothetical protein